VANRNTSSRRSGSGGRGRYPWLIPAVAILAIVVVVGGVVVSLIAGIKLF
jgi:hypothetical protein